MCLWLSHNSELDSLATKHRTDKGPIKTTSLSPKGYTKYYTQWFNPIRSEPLNLLEIGVQHGASVRMWEEYFPKGQIYGIDINEKCKQHEKGRIKIFIGDQSNKEFLKKSAETIKEIHIIIDDGGHKSSLHIPSFETLFSYIVPGGLYIIEDLYATSGSTDFKDTPDKKGTTHDYFKKEVDKLMRSSPEEQGSIESITFHRPKTSGAMMVIQKR